MYKHDIMTLQRIRVCSLDVDVLNEIDLTHVLAERTNADAVRAVAVHVLDKHIGTVGLE